MKIAVTWSPSAEIYMYMHDILLYTYVHVGPQNLHTVGVKRPCNGYPFKKNRIKTGEERPFNGRPFKKTGKERPFKAS